MSDNIENIFIDLLFPKTKPISVGIIYKPPSQTQFLEQMITEFETLDLNNEIYILGDFIVNLLFWDKYVLNKGSFKNDVTAKMPNFRPPSLYVTVSHFFHYTPSPQCHQANSNKVFPWSKTLKNNFTYFV